MRPFTKGVRPSTSDSRGASVTRPVLLTGKQGRGRELPAQDHAARKRPSVGDGLWARLMAWPVGTVPWII